MRAKHHLLPEGAARGHIALDEAEMFRWGRALGAGCAAPLVISLSGDLGAGKTTLAQAICAGYGVTESVTSPTYSLVHRYDAPASAVVHIDLYRLDNEKQLGNLGWEEILSEEALVIIEWPERAGDRMPDDHLHIELQNAPGDPSRRVLLAG
ncbi:MAG: tRNA (adenosine(37)-N6)-threonylcarbamoyltransferase complex ATPase subunit type 1 TsaE [Gemmatimonadaceae bacterium]